MKINPKLSFWNIFEPNWNTDKRIVVNRGWSSSGKTWTLIRIAILWLFYGKIDATDKVFEKWVFSIVRKYSNNLTKSILRDWENLLDETNTRQFLEINKTEKTYKFAWRTIEFIWVDDPQKARWPRRDILYCNEANELDYEDFRQLAMRTNYRIFIDFNPDDEDIWINTEIEQKRAHSEKDVEVIVSTFRDNPHLPDTIVKELERLQNDDPVWWQVYGLGQYWRLEGRIFDFKDISEIPKEARLLGYWLDFWYTNDPTAVVGVYEYGDALILDEMVYESWLTNSDISQRFASIWISKNSEIWADSSEPKSIEEIHRFWWNIHAVTKWPDSVRNGIDIMKRFPLYVTANSLNLRKEGRKYSWKKDRTGKALNVPMDEFNHAIDAARYLIMTKKGEKLKKVFRFDTI